MIPSFSSAVSMTAALWLLVGAEGVAFPDWGAPAFLGSVGGLGAVFSAGWRDAVTSRCFRVRFVGDLLLLLLAPAVLALCLLRGSGKVSMKGWLSSREWEGVNERLPFR